jgi:hypothetical protein
VFISGTFFSICRMSIVSSIVSYVCCVSRMYCAYLEFGLFVPLLVCVLCIFVSFN